MHIRNTTRPLSTRASRRKDSHDNAASRYKRSSKPHFKKNAVKKQSVHTKMPVFFFGHGSPMNAIEDNPFTRHLASLGASLKGRPRAIMVISAHWYTHGTFVSTAAHPAMIYDFQGFPEELYRVVYPAPGSPECAALAMSLAPQIMEDSSHGFDHGAWSVLKHLFPKADIPMFQMSVNADCSLQQHVELAKKLNVLRRRGVLIVCTGNIVHNLRYFFAQDDETPYAWASEFDTWIKEKIMNRDINSLIHYTKAGKIAELSVPDIDHYIPLLYAIALADKHERISFTYERVFRSMSMRSLRVG